MKGINERITNTGINVLEIHYSADPSKDPDTPEGSLWKVRELLGYPGGESGAKWRREMEIDFYVQGGQLVFPNMEANRNRICIKPFDIPAEWSLYGSFDYAGRGVTAFLVHAVNHKEEDYYTVWEFYKVNSGYVNTANAIKKCPYYDRLEWIVADPSIWTPTQEQKGQKELVSMAQLFAEQGIVFMKGKRGGDNEFAELINETLWKGMSEGVQPKYRMFETCEKHWWEMSRWRYMDYTTATQSYRNLKEQMVDKDNHTIDALKYFLTSVNANWMMEQGLDMKNHIIQEDF